MKVIWHTGEFSLNEKRKESMIWRVVETAYRSSKGYLKNPNGYQVSEHNKGDDGQRIL